MSLIKLIKISRLVTFSLVLISSKGNAEQCEDFPGGTLIGRFDEATQIGTVLWTWQMNLEGALLILEPLFGSDAGFLQLSHATTPGQVDIEITLAKSLNMIELNPRPTPYPDTEENVTCPYNGSTTIPPDDKTAINYDLRCISQVNEPLSKSVIVIIEEINDNAPYFMCSPYSKQISEYMVVGSTIFTLRGLAADPEIQGDISGYAIASGAENTFAIRGSSGLGNIALLEKLDYNFGKKEYTLNVTVEDTGNPPLSNWTFLYLEIIDEDDLNPVFNQEVYDISLQEENSGLIGIPHPSIPPVFAYDQDIGINATVRYKLLRGHNVGGVTYFDIDEDSGYLIPLVTLDREDISSFSLVIEAYQVDNPQKRTAVAGLTVTVEDVNDHPPAMSEAIYRLVIPENMPNSLSILQVFASDPDEGDNAVFEFNLIDEEGGFTLDPITGMLYVLNSVLLDRERKSVMDIKVYAKETLTQEKWQSEESIVEITLADLNDNSPVFYPSDNYMYTAQTPLPTTTTIGWVMANDTDEGDNAVVRYSVKRAFPDYSWFAVNPISGVIYLSNDIPTIVGNITISLSVAAQDQAPVPVHRRSTMSYVTVYLLGVDLTTTQETTPDTTTVIPTTSTSVTSLSISAKTSPIPTDSPSTDHSLGTTLRETGPATSPSWTEKPSTTGWTTSGQRSSESHITSEVSSSSSLSSGTTSVATTRNAGQTTDGSSSSTWSKSSPTVPTPQGSVSGESGGTTGAVSSTVDGLTSVMSSSPQSPTLTTAPFGPGTTSLPLVSGISSTRQTSPASSDGATGNRTPSGTATQGTITDQTRTDKTSETILPSCLPPLQQSSERETFLILAIVFGVLMLLFALGFCITAFQLYRIKRLAEASECETKDASQVTNFPSSIGLTCTMTDDYHSRTSSLAPSRTPSLVPSLAPDERSTLKDNAYATINNQVVRDGKSDIVPLNYTPGDNIPKLHNGLNAP